MELHAIVAVADSGIIGKDNQLIWRLSDDLKYFKKVTQGHCIISGRKNYESIGRPLPGRTNIIITRDNSYQAEGCVVVNSLQDAINIAKNENDPTPFIIGGGEIYRLSLPYIHKLYLTEVHQAFEGDVTFPELGKEWIETSRVRNAASEKNQCDFSFVCYENKSVTSLT